MRRFIAAFVLPAALVACSSESGVRSTAAEPAPTSAAPPSTTVPTSAVEIPITEPSTVPDTVDQGGSLVPGNGVGDELFPELGATGIDVRHYDVSLSYDPEADSIAGTVAVDLTATAPLEQLLLDAVGLKITGVTVDGVESEYTVEGAELVVQPAAPLASGAEARVEVRYAARPNAGGGAVGIPNGWFHTEGGSYVLNEPDGARTWMPCNDHPADKATFTFNLTVPAGMTAVANGALAEHRTEAAGEVWVWQQTEPMATYLIQVLTGQYTIEESVTASGLPLLSVAVEGEEGSLAAYTEVTEQQILFFEEYFGPYPLDRYGIAITDSFGGLAMETQGRSLFSREDLGGGLDYIEHLLLSHELAHQWFGDAVTPAAWIDIWLNESFATYAQWMWMEDAGFGAVQESADFALSMRSSQATGTPQVEELFGFNSYDGGAAVLHALRLTIGDEAFFELLQRWVAENDGTSRTSAEFIALASEVAGQDLADFFQEWLYSPDVPARFP